VSGLDSALISAHEAGDGQALARLYAEAGDASGALDEQCFFWTQAYVFALEAGLPLADELRQRLIREGRDA